MPDLYTYTDYRAFLRDWAEQRRAAQPHVSLRFIAMRIGTDAGTVVKIFQGQLHLSPRLLPGVVELCKFTEREAEYFQAMVDFGKARTPSDIRRTFERLGSLKDVRALTLQESQYAFYQRWYHSAIRALIGIKPFEGDHKTLAASLVPPIKPAQAKESLELLERLGLVVRDASDRLVLSEPLITTGEKWHGAAVREFQRQTIDLAAASLDRDPVEQREHSTITLTLRRKDLVFLKTRAAEFRQDLLRIAEAATDEDAVFQVNVQIFPLALLGEVGS